MLISTFIRVDVLKHDSQDHGRETRGKSMYRAHNCFIKTYLRMDIRDHLDRHTQHNWQYNSAFSLDLNPVTPISDQEIASKDLFMMRSWDIIQHSGDVIFPREEWWGD